MDCEKFEAAMMDELYGELDELTSAAAKRHVAGCSRCAALLSGFRATRRLAALPTVEPPEGLEARILAATRDIGTVVPLRRRVARGISLAGTWAMRPQTAMAAVFLVMIGSSVLLLTGKATRAPASASITVTEQGSPTPQPSAVAAASAYASATAAPYATPTPMEQQATVGASPSLARTDIPRDESAAHGATKGAFAPPAPPAKDDGLAGYGGAPSPTAAAPAGGGGAGATGTDADRAGAEDKKVSPFNAAVQSYQAGRYEDATKAFDALAPADPAAELWAARSVREAKGCRAALARFDHVAGRAANTPTAWDALLEGALCYRSVGMFNEAKTRLSALLTVDSHKDRARAELDRLNQTQAGSAGAGPAAAAKARMAPAPAAPPPPAATPARPPASDTANSY